MVLEKRINKTSTYCHLVTLLYFRARNNIGSAAYIQKLSAKVGTKDWCALHARPLQPERGVRYVCGVPSRDTSKRAEPQTSLLDNSRYSRYYSSTRDPLWSRLGLVDLRPTGSEFKS